MRTFKLISLIVLLALALSACGPAAAPAPAAEAPAAASEDLPGDVRNELSRYQERAARLAELRKALPATVSLRYSIKANPYPPLVNFIAGRVDGLDVASAGELQVALQTGTAAENISFAGPGKMDRELEAAVDAER